MQEIPLSALRGRTNTGGDADLSGMTAPELTDAMSDDSKTTHADERAPLSRRRRRWLFASLAVLVLIGAVFVAATLRLIVYPAREQPRHVNAIVSFNGPNEGTRQALAVSLAKKGYAPVLLFSLGSALANTPCPRVSQVSVVCFVDVSGNTRGEAEWAGRYAQRHHWHSLLLVPGRGQATRARLLTGRCFSGQLVVVPTNGPRPPLSEIIHEWGGLFDAVFVDRGC